MNWEDDISKNCLDNEPFNNLSKINNFELIRGERISYLVSQADLANYLNKDNYPIPCSKDRENYNEGNDDLYWLFGLEDYIKVKKILKNLEKPLSKYLDFGCASGRVIRHFLCNENIEIWGTDINQRHIRWINDHLPLIKAIYNNSIPTLPLEDNYFDLITAFSVFTHIDTFETAWLSEIRRCLKHGGIFYATVHDEKTWDIIKKEKNSGPMKVIKKITGDNFELIANSPMPEGRTSYRHTQTGPYRGLVLHSEKYIRNVWGRFFKILDIVPIGHRKQTVIIMEK